VQCGVVWDEEGEEAKRDILDSTTEQTTTNDVAKQRWDHRFPDIVSNGKRCRCLKEDGEGYEVH
jgi:hypothetical protein